MDMPAFNDTMIFVYAIPPRHNMSKGYCFDGGQEVPFLNVDWFNGFDGMTSEHLTEHVMMKKYAKQHEQLLVLSPENAIALVVNT